MKSEAIYNDTDKTLKLIIQNLSAFNSKVVFYSGFAESNISFNGNYKMKN